MRRFDDITTSLSAMAADVVCLQELWFHPDILGRLSQAMGDAYHITSLKRTRSKQDGIAILVSKRFNVLHTVELPLADIGDRVALFDVLGRGTVPEVVVANTHLTFRHGMLDAYLRKRQIGRLLDNIDEHVKRLVLERVPVILAGDFNGDSADPVYRAIVGRGYHSSAKEARGREAGVTHLTHNGQSVGVDFIFFRNGVGRAASADSTPPSPGDTPRLVPTQYDVLPSHLTDTLWPSRAEYSLSDHRPVLTSFDLV